MTTIDPAAILAELRALSHETEWVEFKAARTDFDFRDLCKYCSGLANEANLHGRPWAWLVFGIENRTHAIVGTAYRQQGGKLDQLKHEVAQQLTGGHTVAAIHVLTLPEGRVILFQIPAAPTGQPIAYHGHWYARDGESLVPLSLSELDRIRAQTIAEDWTAGICAQATIADIDPAALAEARKTFTAKHAGRPLAAECQGWDGVTFLDKAKLTVGGAITRTALLLLGRPEAAHHLTPAVTQITWKLEGEQRAYEHFAPPFLLTVNALYQRIRNLKQRVMTADRLVPIEVDTYDRWVVLEALHNAIAHQDYPRGARIVVAEYPDRLVFESVGSFFEGAVEDYWLRERTPARYRNPFLTQAMIHLNMIDTMGYGIRRMFSEQRRRGFPLPDYDFSDPMRVRLTIYGQVIDPNYTALLMQHQDLPLSTVLLLDRVQKRLPIDADGMRLLRREKLVEGRQKQMVVAAHIAAATGTEASYIRNRSLDDQHFKALIVEYLRKFGDASRAKLDEFLLPKLPDLLTSEQKRHRVRNLLHRMSKTDGIIRNTGSRTKPRWLLVVAKGAKTSQAKAPPAKAARTARKSLKKP